MAANEAQILIKLTGVDKTKPLIEAVKKLTESTKNLLGQEKVIKNAMKETRQAVKGTSRAYHKLQSVVAENNKQYKMLERQVKQLQVQYDKIQKKLGQHDQAIAKHNQNVSKTNEKIKELTQTHKANEKAMRDKVRAIKADEAARRQQTREMAAARIAQERLRREEMASLSSLERVELALKEKNSQLKRQELRLKVLAKWKKQGRIDETQYKEAVRKAKDQIKLKTREIEKLIARQRQLQTTQRRTTDRTRRGVSSFRDMARSVIALTAAYIGLRTAARAVRTAIDPAKDFQMYELRLAAILGSFKLARERLKFLEEFNKTTPFELPHLVTANVQLETLTRGLFSAKDAMRLLSDVAVATGKQVEEISFHIGRIYDGLVNQRLVGESLLRMQELGVLSGATRNFLEAGQKAGVPGMELWGAFREEMERFWGVTDIGSRRFQGMLSNLMDVWWTFRQKLGEPIIHFLTPEITRLVEFIDNMKKEGVPRRWGENIAGWLAETRDAFKEGRFIEWFKDNMLSVAERFVGVLYSGVKKLVLFLTNSLRTTAEIFIDSFKKGSLYNSKSVFMKPVLPFVHALVEDFERMFGTSGYQERVNKANREGGEEIQYPLRTTKDGTPILYMGSGANGGSFRVNHHKAAKSFFDEFSKQGELDDAQSVYFDALMNFGREPTNAEFKEFSQKYTIGGGRKQPKSHGEIARQIKLQDTMIAQGSKFSEPTLETMINSLFAGLEGFIQMTPLAGTRIDDKVAAKVKENLKIEEQSNEYARSTLQARKAIQANYADQLRIQEEAKRMAELGLHTERSLFGYTRRVKSPSPTIIPYRMDQPRARAFLGGWELGGKSPFAGPSIEYEEGFAHDLAHPIVQREMTQLTGSFNKMIQFYNRYAKGEGETLSEDALKKMEEAAIGKLVDTNILSQARQRFSEGVAPQYAMLGMTGTRDAYQRDVKQAYELKDRTATTQHEISDITALKKKMTGYLVTLKGIADAQGDMTESMVIQKLLSEGLLEDQAKYIDNEKKQKVLQEEALKKMMDRLPDYFLEMIETAGITTNQYLGAITKEEKKHEASRLVGESRKKAEKERSAIDKQDQESADRSYYQDWRRSQHSKWGSQALGYQKWGDVSRERQLAYLNYQGDKLRPGESFQPPRDNQYGYFEAEQKEFGDGFLGGWESMDGVMQQMEQFQEVGVAAATAVAGAFQGISTSIEGLIMGTMTWQQALSNIGLTILNSIVQAISQMIASYILSMTIGKLMQAFVAKSAVAAMAPVAALNKSAAIDAAIATMGGAVWAGVGAYTIGKGAAVGAGVGISAAGAGAEGAMGSKSGGYTGDVPVDQIAGFHHGQEFVVKASATKRWRGLLESINAGAMPMADSPRFDTASSDAQTAPFSRGGRRFGSGSADHAGGVSVAIYNDKNSAKDWLEQRQGRRLFMRASQRSAEELGLPT